MTGNGSSSADLELLISYQTLVRGYLGPKSLMQVGSVDARHLGVRQSAVEGRSKSG